MYTRIINFIKKSIQEYFPTIAFREGTGVWDLFVKAFAILYNRILERLTTIRNDSDIRNYATMSETALDAQAANWFLTRSEGAYSSGNVRIYLKTPVKVTIPSGFTALSSSGLRFVTREAWSFSAAQVTNNKDGTRYYFDITMYGQNPGSEYNVPSHAIVDLYSPFYADWTRVDNLYAFTGGATKETNSELYDRMVNSANTRNLLITKSSAATTLYEAFPTFKDIVVVGYGEDEMDRDIVYGVVGVGIDVPYRRQDFYGKSRGDLFTNPCVSYEISSTSKAPLIAELASATEVSQEDYHYLSAYDLIYYTYQGGLLFSDDFDDSDTFDMTDGYIASDSGFVFGRRAYGNSVYIGGGNLYMGATDAESVPI